MNKVLDTDLESLREQDPEGYLKALKIKQEHGAGNFLETYFGSYVESLAKESALHDRVLCYLDTARPEIFRDEVNAILNLGFKRQEVVDFINAKIEKAREDRMNEVHG